MGVFQQHALLVISIFCSDLEQIYLHPADPFELQQECKALSIWKYGFSDKALLMAVESRELVEVFACIKDFIIKPFICQQPETQNPCTCTAGNQHIYPTPYIDNITKLQFQNLFLLISKPKVTAVITSPSCCIAGQRVSPSARVYCSLLMIQ